MAPVTRPMVDIRRAAARTGTAVYGSREPGRKRKSAGCSLPSAVHSRLITVDCGMTAKAGLKDAPRVSELS